MNNLAQAVPIGTTFFGGATSFTSLAGIGSLVSLFLNVAFAIAGIILIFYFIMGGIGMISSAGANDPQKLEQSRKTITSALIGFIIVFVSFWIVQFIGQLFGITGLPVFQQLFYSVK